jgi:hypothetical protein
MKPITLNGIALIVLGVSPGQASEIPLRCLLPLQQP